MAKDPAFLFYSNDFLTGTYTMTDEQVGKYIRLLCLQHQKKYLSEKDMLNICKSYDEDIYCKFAKDENGFYNERLREVAEKRKSYSDSRSKNRKSKDILNISSSYVPHMENEIENEIVIENKILLKGKKYLSEDFKELPNQYYLSLIEQMKIVKQTEVNKNQIELLWESFKLEKLTGETYYNNESEVYKYFVNWIKNQKFETNGKSIADKKIDAYSEWHNRYS
jgi:bifunctional N-acetylglucosamine-1-phosphate-uridyltransferase/glucosamine-1-phosphate-acetyltransferase GlmU-like protein